MLLPVSMLRVLLHLARKRYVVWDAYRCEFGDCTTSFKEDDEGISRLTDFDYNKFVKQRGQLLAAEAS